MAAYGRLLPVTSGSYRPIIAAVELFYRLFRFLNHGPRF